MAVFTDSEQFYACTRAAFARMAQQDPGAEDIIARTGMILRLSVFDPPGQITLDGRRKPVQTIIGESTLRPDLEVSMSATTLHRILMGELSGLSALGAGLLKVRGSVLKVLTLGELFHRLQAVYPDILREQGLA